jgi:uncharacterized membrane protein
MLFLVWTIQIVWLLLWIDPLHIWELSVLISFIGFLSLTWIPGILLLRVLKLHKLGTATTVTMAIGLGVSIVMLMGLVDNSSYLILGWPDKPITSLTLIATFTVMTVFLSFLAYIRDNDYTDAPLDKSGSICLFKAAYLVLLPILVVLGALLVNVFQNDRLIVGVQVALVLIPLLFINEKKMYPFAIWILSISLLFSNSLISYHIWGGDIHTEYFLSQLVLKSGHWTPVISSQSMPLNDVNGMLSIVMLAPIYSVGLGLRLTWVYKVIYPLLFSLVPVVLYLAYLDWLGNEKNQKWLHIIAYGAAIYFISILPAHSEMLTLGRQEIAELFVSLLILVVRKDRGIAKSFLSLVFGMSLVVSHYGTSWVVAIAAIMSVFIDILLRRRINRYISLTVLGVILVSMFGWYMYTSHSANLAVAMDTGKGILLGMFRGRSFNPRYVQGLHLAVQKVSAVASGVARDLYVVAEGLTVVGAAVRIFEQNVNTFDVIAIPYLLISILSVIIPGLSSSLNSPRMFQIASLFMAPYAIIGAISIMGFFQNLTRNKASHVFQVGFVGSCISLFLLFNTAVPYKVLREKVTAYVYANLGVQYPLFTDYDAAGAEWLARYYHSSKIYGTVNGWGPLEEHLAIPGVRLVYSDTHSLGPESYLFLRQHDVVDNTIMRTYNPSEIGIPEDFVALNTSDLYREVIGRSCLIYSNGSEIYLTK